MNLKILINNYIIYNTILKYLDNKSRINLSESCKDVYNDMYTYGYFSIVYFKCDDLNNYIYTLELIEKHKKYLTTIIIYKQHDIFTYLPESFIDTYKLIFKYCNIYIDEKNSELIRKIKVKNKSMKIYYNTPLSTFYNCSVSYLNDNTYDLIAEV